MQWHGQRQWRCNAIQELQTLSDIASSANFETDDDDDAVEEEMLMKNKSLVRFRGAQCQAKGIVRKMMNIALIFSWVATL